MSPKINIKSALGISLMGKTVGQKIHVGQMDNNAKVLEIVNKSKQ